MKKIFLFIQLSVFLLLTSAFHSCFSIPVDPYIVDIDRQRENSYHASPALHAPLLSQKKDLSLALHYAFLSRHSGVDFQGAYVPVNHLGLQASFRSYGQTGKPRDGKIESYAFGAGYVQDWGNFLVETYAGIGGGSVQNFHHTGQSRINFTNYYIQPTIAVQSKDRSTQFALVARLSPTKFEIRDTSFEGAREPFVVKQFNQLSKNLNRFYVEPGLVFRTGWDHVQFQTAISLSLTKKSNDFLRDKSNFSFGLVFRLNASDK
jgi:hypothetical protein